MLGMAACLLVFLAVRSASASCGVSRGLRTRVVEQELPAVVGEIRND